MALNMSMCASYVRADLNVRQEVVTRAIDCKGNNRSTVACREDKISESKKEEEEEKKQKPEISFNPVN